ncbi:MAG: hypothetical protein DHS20C14_14130 [Phycisphaeraceae bacterium]|nr:MAG: hypothetical protein DHS20C14_14130 [Phycisphaeraceae bacterium]
MADPATTNAYLRTRVMTASPEELRLLLLEGALRFANQAKAGLESKDFEAALAGFSQCRDIVLELLTSVRPEHDPQLAERVRSLYTFMYSELVSASFDKDIPKLAKVIELLEYERETWVLLMDQVAKERGVSEPKPAADTTDAERAPLSIQA